MHKLLNYWRHHWLKVNRNQRKQNLYYFRIRIKMHATHTYKITRPLPKNNDVLQLTFGKLLFIFIISEGMIRIILERILKYLKRLTIPWLFFYIIHYSRHFTYNIAACRYEQTSKGVQLFYNNFRYKNVTIFDDLGQD